MLQVLARPAVGRALGAIIMALGVAWIVVATVLLFMRAFEGRLGSGEGRFREYDLYMMFNFAGVTGAGALVILIGLAIWHRRARGISALACFAAAAASLVWLLNVFLPWRGVAIIPLAFFTLVLIHLLVAGRQPRLNQVGPVVRPDPLTDSNWREWLLASLRDTGVQPRNRFMSTVRTFLLIAVIIIAARLIGYIQFPSRNALIAFYIVWYAFAILVLIPFFIRQVRQNAQSRQRSAEEELAEPGSRRPILYLRSFAFDQQLERKWPSFIEFLVQRPRANPEQELAHELRKCGPVIAIGRPDEKLPALGAARFYVSHERWQEKVSDIVRVCRLVVVTSGVTEGLRWELEHLARSLDPQRLILWCHPQIMKLEGEAREAEWHRFVDSLGDAFPKPLPRTLGETHFIHFDADFRPIAVAPTKTWGAMRSALRALLAAKGLIAPDPVARAARRRKLRHAAAAVAGWLVVSFAAAGVAFLISSRVVVARNDQSAFDQLASEITGAEWNRTPEATLQRLKTIAEWSDNDWQIIKQISAAAAAKLREPLKTYVTAFNAAHLHPSLYQAMFGLGRPLIFGQSAIEAFPVSAFARTCVLTFQSFQSDIANYKATQPPELLWTNRIERRVAARIKMLEAEIALVDLLAETAAAKPAMLPDGATDMKLTYRDRALQAKADELLARRREAQRALRAELAR